MSDKQTTLDDQITAMYDVEQQALEFDPNALPTANPKLNETFIGMFNTNIPELVDYKDKKTGEMKGGLAHKVIDKSGILYNFWVTSKTARNCIAVIARKYNNQLSGVMFVATKKNMSNKAGQAFEGYNIRDVTEQYGRGAFDQQKQN